MIEAKRMGSGPKLLLVHGLGGSWRSWEPVLSALPAKREVIAIDLPAHGASPREAGDGTFSGLTASVEAFIADNGLTGIDVAGVSLGGRIVLELARRGVVGNAVAIDPGGFWQGWERAYFRWTLTASLQLVRALRGNLGALSENAVSRLALLAQLSARPGTLAPALVERELRGFASTPTVGPLIRDLANGPPQEGPAAPSAGQVTIGWGRKDRLCPAHQATRARAAFPNARFHWFEASGHYPIWDCPAEAGDAILAATASGPSRG
jgi:pimeloyl-ACP methyl ester carboxylesterase